MSDLPTAAELRAAMRDKVAQLQSDLTAAKAENEALRGRVAELEEDSVKAGIGKMVSIDVSTCDEDSGNRVFGRIIDFQDRAPDDSYGVYLAELDQFNYEPVPSRAWVMRERAEALEAEAKEWADKKTSQISEDILESAQRLRQQAEAAEKGGDDD